MTHLINTLNPIHLLLRIDFPTSNYWEAHQLLSQLLENVPFVIVFCWDLSSSPFLPLLPLYDY